ncbi:hypothetical protein PBR20603_01485 [Pandoraea bronchicola]|uniref:Uncharacterized protein n=1 Tax=Pandoraea bronchicola TaxID=2508287 RepID=A0A5E5BNX4_9BURK|nr:hypothetical protein PBR20603_01485 [Pandoraea bronchicola]
MPVFELYNPDGSLQLDLSKRLSRKIGQVAVTGSGSFSVPVSNANCRVWAFSNVSGSAVGTVVSLRSSGNVVSYAVYSPSGATVTVYYGEY